MNTTLREMDFTPSQRRAFARTLCRTIESKAEGDSGASELIGFYNEDGTVKSFWKIKLTELQRIGGLVRSFPDQDMVILHASRGELRGISDFKDGNTVTIYAMTHTRKGEPR